MPCLNDTHVRPSSASRSGSPLSLGSFALQLPTNITYRSVAKEIYKAKPAAVFSFDEIREAQRLMESNKANGKIIVKL